MKKETFLDLLEKYQTNTATPAERELVDRLYESLSNSPVTQLDDQERQLLDRVRNNLVLQTQSAVEPAPVVAPLVEMEAENPRRISKWLRRTVAAAAVIIIVASGTWLLLNPGTDKADQIAKISDVKPGKTGAILKLADGRTVILDTASNGRLLEGFTKSTKELAINDTKIPVQLAMVSTPRARQQVVTLDDGTRVWLNSASSIQFPTKFTGDTREVEITGEVYFEVAKDAAHPFIVKNAGEPVQVLGTHFNVNAYPEEGPVRVTLLEGAVKIADKTLKPGEQYNAGKVAQVDVESVVAWQSGFFEFNEYTLESILRQVSRWYDIDVEYETRPDSHLRFGGRISKDVTLDGVLKQMENKGIRFHMENGKLIVGK